MAVVEPHATGRRLRNAVCILLYLFSAQFALIAFLQKPGNPHDFERARLPDLVNGTAHRPFVYRAAFPLALRCAWQLIPDGLQVRLAQAATDNRAIGYFFNSTPADEDRDPVLYLIAYALEFVSLIAFAFLLRSMIRHFYDCDGWRADLLPIVALCGLPIFFRYISYDYDFPNLLIFTLGLFLLARRSWTSYFLWLPFCGLAKETALLLVVIHVLVGVSTMPRRSLVLNALAQLAILGVVRGLLQFVVFRDNPGSPVEYWLDRNWAMITSVDQWGFLFFHFAWVGKTSLVIPTNYNLLFLILLPLIFRRWSKQPIFLRRAFWIVPILTLLTMFFGYIDEMRAYYEAYPVVFLLASGTVCRR